MAEQVEPIAMFQISSQEEPSTIPAQVEPIAMPQMPQYQPQVNVGPDDPDSYMMLVPANINTKRPILQTFFTGLAITFAIFALAIDEISDGDIVYSNGKPEIDYDCGWKEFRLSVEGYSEHYHYAGEYCDQNDEVIDQDFCEDSIKNGIIWISAGIIGILSLILSLVVIFNAQYGGKDSPLYAALLLSGSLCFCMASFWWWVRDRCEDVEQYDEEYLEADFDTSPGKSLYLMWTAVAMTFGALLITALHLSNKHYRQYSQRRHAQSVPRVQSHQVVNY